MYIEILPPKTVGRQILVPRDVVISLRSLVLHLCPRSHSEHLNASAKRNIKSTKEFDNATKEFDNNAYSPTSETKD